MRITAKTEYACLAMLELAASHGDGEPVRIRQIAQRHGIPSRFLVQILLQLKGAGLVASTRGASGGYQLSRPPSTISLADVMSVVDGQEDVTAGLGVRETPTALALRTTWREVAEAQREMLAAVSLADLIDRSVRHAEQMYYI